MDRIDKLCAYLKPCKQFADVGCDHGYCTLFMLKNGLCERAYISDISQKCLDKAEKLLSGYIESGACVPVCCNGLEGIPRTVDEVLIAGMGGEEIALILKNSFVPDNFVLQPMKNVRIVRELLISLGAVIMVDEPFESGGKYYFVIAGRAKGKKEKYSRAQLEYGKNLKSETLKNYLQTELEKKLGYLKNDLDPAARTKIVSEAEFIKGVISGEIE